jgi:trehalose-6-phosphatase
MTYRTFSYLGDKGAADEPCCAGDQTEDQEVFSTVGKGLEQPKANEGQKAASTPGNSSLLAIKATLTVLG